MAPVVDLPAPPRLPRLYARGVLTARGRRGGDRLPDRELTVRDVGADPDRLAAYARVCGFRFGDELPATYPHVLAFPLQLALMTDPGFPFALPGLVHVRNEVTVRRPLTLADRFALRVHAERLVPHARGAQVDLVSVAELDGAEAWTGRNTYLARGARVPGDPPPRAEPSPPDVTSAVWRVPAGTGRRYAAVAGDVNPIHLHPWAARLFGFDRAVAHGMWTKARCLAALEGRLPDAFTYEVDFRKPVLLPATVAFGAEPADGGWTLALRSTRSDAVHLTGRISKLSEPQPAIAG